MTKKCAVLLLLVARFPVWAANESLFAVNEAHRDANGITLRTAAGAMQIEACGDHAIHVVVSPTSQIPTSKIPVAVQPCRAGNIQVKIGPKDVTLSTTAIT